MSNTTTIAARQAARAKRIAKAQMVEDVADAKVMLQDARDNGINSENADYLRGLIESIIEATMIEDEEPVVPITELETEAQTKRRDENPAKSTGKNPDHSDAINRTFDAAVKAAKGE